MYTLYFAPGSAAMAPHAALEECGAPYRLVRVDLAAGEHRRPDYLKLNPHGRVPTLLDGGQALYESAALVMHIADRHPSAGLAPAAGTPARGLYAQWLFYLSNTVQDAFMAYFHPDQLARTDAARAEVKAVAEERLATMWDRLDAALAAGPYLLGPSVSGADLQLAMLARWSRNMARPAWSWPNLRRCIDLVRVRPAWDRMLRAQGIPWIA